MNQYEANILIVAPPPIVQPQGAIADKFQGAEKRAVGLADELKKVAESKSSHFFDSGSVTAASTVDGIHLDQDQHQILGKALSPIVSKILLSE